jgi:methionine synthase II (cobalamin-independent)
MFWGTFFEELNGMKELQLGVLKGYDASMFRDYAPDVKSFMEAKEIPNAVTVCVGKISHPGTSSYQREVDIMKKLVPEPEWKNIKITMISPSWYHFRYRNGRSYPKDVYANDDEYFADVARAYQTELQILHDQGIRNIQIDDPNLAYFCSQAMLDGWKADTGNDKTADEMFDAYVKFYNQCFQRPADMHLGIHLCRGNYVGSRHFSEGAYDIIAQKLFQDLDVDTYYLEYDTPRAGGFEPLVHLPKNKNVVLGVVTSKFPELEDKDEMVKRVQQAAEFIAKGSGESREEALQRVCVSPQCGFASHAEGNALGYEDMRRKLQLVRAIADQVWPGEP